MSSTDVVPLECRETDSRRSQDRREKFSSLIASAYDIIDANKLQTQVILIHLIIFYRLDRTRRNEFTCLAENRFNECSEDNIIINTF